MDRRIISRQRCRHCGQGHTTFGTGPHGEPALLCRCQHPATLYTLRFKYQGELFSVAGIKSYLEARDLLRDIDKDIEAKSFDPARYRPRRHQAMLVENYLARWLSHSKDRLERGQLSPETVRNRRRIVRRLAEAFAGQDIRDLRYGHFEDYAGELLQGDLSPKTVSNILTELRSCLRWAKRRGELETMPEFPLISHDRRPMKWTTAEVQGQVLDAIPAEHRPLYEFLVTYGRRPGEARALMWDCIDWAQKSITIRRAFSRNTLRESTKTHHVTILPMVEPVESTLRRVTRLSPSFVFVHSGTGQPYSAFQTWNIWTQAAKKAGVDISLYEGTRHSKVTQLIAEGHDLNLVGELVGHVTPTTTKRYLGQDATRLVRLFQGKIVDLKPDGKKS